MKFIKTSICLLLLLSLSVTAFAQKKPFGVPNLQRYDEKLFHFGFLIGYNQFDFAIDPKSDLSSFDSLMVINTSSLSGFNLGIVTNLRLGKYFDLRFIPGLSFGDRIVNYTVSYGDTATVITKKNVESVYLDLPLLIKLKSSRMHNVRAYVVAGAQYSLDLISAAKKKSSSSRNNMQLKLYPHDFQVQVGVGLDFYFTWFKFSTEFKMSFGMVNLLVHDGTPYSESVNSLKSKMLQVSFLFE